MSGDRNVVAICNVSIGWCIVQQPLIRLHITSHKLRITERRITPGWVAGKSAVNILLHDPAQRPATTETIYLSVETSSPPRPGPQAAAVISDLEPVLQTTQVNGKVLKEIPFKETLWKSCESFRMLPQALQGDPLPVVSLQQEIFLNDYQNIFSLPTMDNRTLKGLIASVGCSMEFYLKILKEIKVKYFHIFYFHGMTIKYAAIW